MSLCGSINLDLTYHIVKDAVKTSITVDHVANYLPTEYMKRSAFLVYASSVPLAP